MCKWHGGNYEGNLRVELAHPRKDGIDYCHVDACIQPLVQAINDAGIQTINSCCGHGQIPTTVALNDGRYVIVAKDFAEFKQIMGQFPALTMENA